MHTSCALKFPVQKSKMLRILLHSSMNKTFKEACYSTSIDPSSSLTLHFLKNSCGLSQETALTVSKKIHFKRTKTPHAVVTLLKSFNFSKPDIKKVVTRFPELLLRNPDKFVKPKLDFLNNIGFSGPALVYLLTCVPKLLRPNLEKKLLPNYKILKNVLKTDENVKSAITSSTALLLMDLEKKLLPKLKLLEENGVSADVVNKLLTMRSDCLVGRSDRFDEIFEFVKKTGISTKSSMYAHAFSVLGRMGKTEWEVKIENFKKLGWSVEDIMIAFMKHPYCMSASTDKIVKNFQFYKEEFGWDSVYVSRNAAMLSYSFEKRVLPRYRLLNMLQRKGLYRGQFTARHLTLGEKHFLVNYVMKNYKEVSELIDDDIRRRLEILGLVN